MPTPIVTASPTSIANAAEILRRGGLVAFPTETVYGLGANALDAGAVARIFEAKGRPADNPIIVHLPEASMVPIVADLRGLTPPGSPGIVHKLAERFWPGPLTLVLPKHPNVPDIVTAGGPTVAVRVPAHPIARALLEATQLPLAAPSANRSSKLSPTTAEHVKKSLEGRIDMILDGGPCPGGIESTVLDVTSDPPRLLRPGLITVERIESIIGPIRRFAPSDSTLPLASPGLLNRHYSPQCPLEVAIDDGQARVEQLISLGLRVGWLTWPDVPELAAAVRIELPRDPVVYAARLYAALHDLDAAGVQHIVVARPPETNDWLAIRDRLRRAATV
jgi:L-threonylcarbamoyladenylate synthase